MQKLNLRPLYASDKGHKQQTPRPETELERRGGSAQEQNPPKAGSDKQPANPQHKGQQRPESGGESSSESGQ